MGGAVRLFSRGLAWYSEAMPRGGPAGTFSFGVATVARGSTLTVAIEHRNRDENTWVTAGTFGAISSGVSTKDITNIKELWRWFFTAGGAPDDFTVAPGAVAWRPKRRRGS